MLVIFVALIAGPIVAGKFLNNLPSIPLQLLQPTGQNNNDTSSQLTGTGLPGGGAVAAAPTSTSPFGRARLI